MKNYSPTDAVKDIDFADKLRGGPRTFLGLCLSFFAAAGALIMSRHGYTIPR